MRAKGRIVWIDDNPGRSRTAENLSDEADYRVEFIDVNKKNLSTEISSVLSGRRPALVIVDHVLDKTTATNRIFKTGSTVAEAIREKWPRCPVIGVTAAEYRENIDVRTKKTYDELFFFPNFSQAIPRVSVIADGFARIASGKSDALIRLLCAPQDDRPRLKAALPDDLKSEEDDPSLPSRFYDWVQHMLMDRPGFLYDELWCATFLGIKEVAFPKVRKLIAKAAYTGLFAFRNKERWWVSSVSAILFKKVSPESGEMSWHVGRRLPGLGARDYSVCAVCGEPYPEIVGFVDSNSDDRKPMHLHCSVLHPKFKKELYFEDMRMMKGA